MLIKDRNAVVLGTHLSPSAFATEASILEEVINKASSEKEANSELLMVTFALRSRMLFQRIVMH